MQNFDICVISLPDQHVRREKIRKIFAPHTAAWSFVDAIAGKDLSPSHPAWTHYHQSKRVGMVGYDMRPNEIACFLSHQKAWQRCVDNQTPTLILEDDIKIKEKLDFEEFIATTNQACTFLNANFIIRLGNTHYKTKNTILKKISESFSLARYQEDPQSAFAYLISPQTAAKLLRHSEKFFTPVDNFMWRGWEHSCHVLDIVPDLVYTSEEDNPSNIGDRSKPKISLVKKIRREILRPVLNRGKKFYELTALKKIQSSIKVQDD